MFTFMRFKNFILVPSLCTNGDNNGDPDKKDILDLFYDMFVKPLGDYKSVWMNIYGGYEGRSGGLIVEFEEQPSILDLLYVYTVEWQKCFPEESKSFECGLPCRGFSIACKDDKLYFSPQFNWKRKIFVRRI